MKNYQKGFVTQVVVMLIAVVVIGAGIYLYVAGVNNGTVQTITDKIMSYVHPGSTSTTTTASSTTLFTVENAPDYAITFSVGNCNDASCSGPGSVDIKDAGTGNLIQTIHSDNLYFSEDDGTSTSVDYTGSYQNDGPVLVGDFNFDGSNDLAVANGIGSYGSPVYDIYLYNSAEKQFVLNQPLTNLGLNSQGLFTVDTVKKVLTISSKSGCCSHFNSEYQVVNNMPKLIETTFIDTESKPGETIATDSKLINGSWSTTTKVVNQGA